MNTRVNLFGEDGKDWNFYLRNMCETQFPEIEIWRIVLAQLEIKLYTKQYTIHVLKWLKSKNYNNYKS